MGTTWSSLLEIIVPRTSQPQGVILLELNQLTLVRRQENAAHKAGDAKLFNDLQQVYLCVELLSSLSEQLRFRVNSESLLGRFVAPTTAPATALQAAAQYAVQFTFESSAAVLRPCIPEDVPLHDRVFQFFLLRVVLVPIY